MIVAVRIFLVGGVTSFRALFYWLSPWIYIPTMLVAPIFQILLFAYIGRSAGLESDEFYLIGNALQYAAIPCLFAMAQMVGGERYQSTLSAILVSPAPRHFALVLLPATLGLATIGLYNLVATLLWGRFVFGVHLPIAHPLLFGLAIVGTVLAFGGLGFLFAVSFVRWRAAWVLGNFFEYPVWLICGFLVPLALLPGWVRPISWVLAPTWGMNAIRESALGGTPLPDLILCLGLGAAYIALGVLVTNRVLYDARDRGSLSLT